MKVGLFGGSFDPPHFGHIMIAKTIIQQLDLDELNVCPTGSPVGKKSSVSQDFHKRLCLSRLAFSNIARLNVVDWEKNDNLSYTVDTVTKMRKMYSDNDEFYLVLGLDSFLKITSWKNYRLLFKLTKLVVFLRGKEGRKRFDRQLGELSSVFSNPNSVICMVDKIPSVSSTDIRKKILQNDPVDDLLPKEIEFLYSSYIKNN